MDQRGAAALKPDTCSSAVISATATADLSGGDTHVFASASIFGTGPIFRTKPDHRAVFGLDAISPLQSRMLIRASVATRGLDGELRRL